MLRDDDGKAAKHIPASSHGDPVHARPAGDGVALRWISLAAAVAVAGAAFASGVIHFGAPAPKVGFFRRARPRAGDGALTPGSVRMLPVFHTRPGGRCALGD